MGSDSPTREWRRIEPILALDLAPADRAAFLGRAYGLGVILYRKVTGAPPYDVHDRPLTEAIRGIREERGRSRPRPWSPRAVHGIAQDGRTHGARPIGGSPRRP
jgi:hypothetical protein